MRTLLSAQLRPYNQLTITNTPSLDDMEISDTNVKLFASDYLDSLAFFHHVSWQTVDWVSLCFVFLEYRIFGVLERGLMADTGISHNEIRVYDFFSIRSSCEGRMILAYYRFSYFEDAFNSMDTLLRQVWAFYAVFVRRNSFALSHMSSLLAHSAWI
jgi:hypothetical protein